MIFYPKDYFKRVEEITYEYLQEHHIQGLILDVDNTLIDYHENLSQEVASWIEEMKQKQIRLMIVSNSLSQRKIKTVAEKLDIEYIHFARKPLKRGFKKAQKELGIAREHIAVVGDQIFTDVMGGNRMKMYSILIEPIAEKDIWATLLKRPVENFIKRRYFKSGGID